MVHVKLWLLLTLLSTAGFGSLPCILNACSGDVMTISCTNLSVTDIGSGIRHPRPRVLLKAPTLAEMEEMNISEVRGMKTLRRQSRGGTRSTGKAREPGKPSQQLEVTMGYSTNGLGLALLIGVPKKAAHRHDPSFCGQTAEHPLAGGQGSHRGAPWPPWLLSAAFPTSWWQLSFSLLLYQVCPTLVLPEGLMDGLGIKAFATNCPGMGGQSRTWW